MEKYVKQAAKVAGRVLMTGMGISMFAASILMASMAGGLTTGKAHLSVGNRRIF